MKVHIQMELLLTVTEPMVVHTLSSLQIMDTNATPVLVVITTAKVFTMDAMEELFGVREPTQLIPIYVQPHCTVVVLEKMADLLQLFQNLANHLMKDHIHMELLLTVTEAMVHHILSSQKWQNAAAMEMHTFAKEGIMDVQEEVFGDQESTPPIQTNAQRHYTLVLSEIMVEILPLLNNLGK